MGFDGFVTHALVQELSNQLINARIHKIYQPHETDLLLNIRSHGKNNSLLLSANPTYPRIFITNRSFINPVEPPMFCMLLRKHLEGGVIERVSQKDNERIIHIDVQIRDDLGDIQKRRLIIEIMGKHSNIVLVNPTTNIIIDGIKHVSAAISSYRQILPGREYVEPPEQHKLHPLYVSEEQFFSVIQLNEGKLDKQLVQHFTGMSPSFAKEIIHQASLPTRENLWNTYYNIMNKIKSDSYEPAIVISENKTDFSIIPLTHIEGEIVKYPTINDCMEEFYDQKADRDTIRQKVVDLSKIVINEKNKNLKKIEYLIKDREKAEDADKYRLYGELVTAHIHQLKRGDKEAEVINYYDEAQQTIKIPLDPLKTPSENAQTFFKTYNKRKNSLSFIETELAKTKIEIEYLETIITQLEIADVEDIEEIRQELVEQKYLKDRSRNRNKKKKQKNPEIEKYISSEGIPIYIGKNNRQNEYLTQRVASSSDTWLHTKDIPGSHVVIKAKEYNETTLLEAAMLSAYFSKAKDSSKVPVDYTLIKHVKKPNGAKPGFVTYDNQKTIFVTPDKKAVESLKSER